jgi:hypothetical protein
MPFAVHPFAATQLHQTGHSCSAQQFWHSRSAVRIKLPLTVSNPMSAKPYPRFVRPLNHLASNSVSRIGQSGTSP